MCKADIPLGPTASTRATTIVRRFCMKKPILLGTLFLNESVPGTADVLQGMSVTRFAQVFEKMQVIFKVQS